MKERQIWGGQKIEEERREEMARCLGRSVLCRAGRAGADEKQQAVMSETGAAAQGCLQQVMALCWGSSQLLQG